MLKIKIMESTNRSTQKQQQKYMHQLLSVMFFLFLFRFLNFLQICTQMFLLHWCKSRAKRVNTESLEKKNRTQEDIIILLLNPQIVRHCFHRKQVCVCFTINGTDIQQQKIEITCHLYTFTFTNIHIIEPSSSQVMQGLKNKHNNKTIL